MIEELQSWAEVTPQVHRLWIWGSRAYGTPRKDSDLDIAVEINLPAYATHGLERFWILNGALMQESLQRALGQSIRVDMELYHRYWGKPAYAAISRFGLEPLYRRQISRGRSQNQQASGRPLS